MTPTAPLVPARDDPSPGSQLGLMDAVSLIIGIVIGAGIYETAPFILGSVSGPGEAMLVWGLGGVLSVVGALCYAELATTYPRHGGDYYFQRRAFGPATAFLFSWSQLTIIMSGSIGLMAFVFADYAVRFFGLESADAVWLAVLSVTVLSGINIVGLRSGRRTQNLLTLLKAIGLLAIVLAGFCWPQAPRGASPAPSGGGSNFGLALILVLYTYGGWNDAAFVVAEMKDKRRNIPRALLAGTAGVALIYMLVNAAYLNALGYDAAKSSRAIAADVLEGPLGPGGARFMSALVMISALGAVNGLILTGARIYAAAGADFPAFSVLARWHSQRGTPLGALVAQLVVTLGLVLLVGHPTGRALLAGMFTATGIGTVSWEGHGGFDTLLKCTAPVFWAFFLLTGVSLFVLRARDRDIERPFTVPLHPVLPLVFCAMCAYMLYSAVNYAGVLSLLGLGVLVAGGVVYLCFGRFEANSRSSRTRSR